MGTRTMRTRTRTSSTSNAYPTSSTRRWRRPPTARPSRDEHEAISDEHEVAEPRTEVHQAAPQTDEHEAAPAEKRGSDEDVLEETPDFLEEAPEDDQLWFEQKPPKDFDFDD